MLIDLTLRITPQMILDAHGNEKMSYTGHLGTHFDVMDKEFPLEYTERQGIVFDVSHVKDRDIDVPDINMDEVSQDMFVAFYTGFTDKVGYGSEAYYKEHPQLSNALIDALLDKKVSIIGVDFERISNGAESTVKNQYCADRNTFVVENLCNLKADVEIGRHFTACTYPMNYSGMTGLPCRVVARERTM